VELKDKIIERLKLGKKLPIHNCSFCNYECGFYSDGKALYYDNGCYCGGSGEHRPKSWDDLDFYLQQKGFMPNFETFIK